MEVVGRSHGRLRPCASRIIEAVANKVLVVASISFDTVILSVITGWEASFASVVHGVPQSFTSEKSASWWTPANKRSRWLPLPVSPVTQRSVACCSKSINATARSSQLRVTHYSLRVVTPFDLPRTWPLRPLGWSEVAAKVLYRFELLRDVRHQATNCLYRLTKERRHNGGTDDLEPRGNVIRIVFLCPVQALLWCERWH